MFQPGICRGEMVNQRLGCTPDPPHPPPNMSVITAYLRDTEVIYGAVVTSGVGPDVPSAAVQISGQLQEMRGRPCSRHAVAPRSQPN